MNIGERRALRRGLKRAILVVMHVQVSMVGLYHIDSVRQLQAPGSSRCFETSTASLPTRLIISI